MAITDRHRRSQSSPLTSFRGTPLPACQRDSDHREGQHNRCYLVLPAVAPVNLQGALTAPHDRPRVPSPILHCHCCVVCVSFLLLLSVIFCLACLSLVLFAFLHVLCLLPMCAFLWGRTVSAVFHHR